MIFISSLPLSFRDVSIAFVAPLIAMEYDHDRCSGEIQVTVFGSTLNGKYTS